MNLIQRYKRLGVWARLGVWGSLASIVALIPLAIPQEKPMRAGSSIVQNVFDSPNSINVAAETVVVGEPRMPPEDIKVAIRSILTDIHPSVIQAVDEGAQSFELCMSQTHLRQFESLDRKGSLAPFLEIAVLGQGPFVVGGGNSGNVLYDQLQDGLLMRCTLTFRDQLRK